MEQNNNKKGVCCCCCCFTRCLLACVRFFSLSHSLGRTFDSARCLLLEQRERSGKLCCVAAAAAWFVSRFFHPLASYSSSSAHLNGRFGSSSSSLLEQAQHKSSVVGVVVALLPAQRERQKEQMIRFRTKAQHQHQQQHTHTTCLLADRWKKPPARARVGFFEEWAWSFVCKVVLFGSGAQSTDRPSNWVSESVSWWQKSEQIARAQVNRLHTHTQTDSAWRTQCASWRQCVWHMLLLLMLMLLKQFFLFKTLCTFVCGFFRFWWKKCARSRCSLHTIIMSITIILVVCLSSSARTKSSSSSSAVCESKNSKLCSLFSSSFSFSLLVLLLFSSLKSFRFKIIKKLVFARAGKKLLDFLRLVCVQNKMKNRESLQVLCTLFWLHFSKNFARTQKEREKKRKKKRKRPLEKKP